MTEFIDWILSIEEDEPVPYEVNHIYFCILDKNSICYAGSEMLGDTNNFEYYPLDGQYFKILDISTEKLKKIISNALENRNFSKIFKNKQIHIIKINQKVEYTFKN